jgi:hypothetical protein
MKNMDKLTFVHKNWPFDSQISYLKHIDVASTCEVESYLMVELEVVFENQVDDENSLDLHYVY